METKKHQLSDFMEFVNASDGILHVKAKGFLSKGAAIDIREEFLGTWKKMVDSCHGKSFVSIADLRDSSIPSDEGKAFIVESISYAISKGLVGAIEVVSGSLVKMAAKRIMPSAEVHKKMDFRYQVETLEEAYAKAQEMLMTA